MSEKVYKEIKRKQTTVYLDPLHVKFVEKNENIENISKFVRWLFNEYNPYKQFKKEQEEG